jgi:site-specific recombinase XerD
VHRDFHRTIHLAQGTVSALTRHKRGVQAQERLRAGEIWQEHDLVFATEIGRPLEGGYVNERFHRAIARAGVPDLRVHDLRHTAATLLLTRGVHPKIVQEMLWHSTITLTFETYSHAAPTPHAEAAPSERTVRRRCVSVEAALLAAGIKLGPIAEPPRSHW